MTTDSSLVSASYSNTLKETKTGFYFPWFAVPVQDRPVGSYRPSAVASMMSCR